MTAQQTSVTREIDWKLICNTVVSHVVFMDLIPLLNLLFCGPEIIGQLAVLQGISGSLLKASYFWSQLVQFLMRISRKYCKSDIYSVISLILLFLVQGTLRKIESPAHYVRAWKEKPSICFLNLVTTKNYPAMPPGHLLSRTMLLLPSWQSLICILTQLTRSPKGRQLCSGGGLVDYPIPVASVTHQYQAD